MQAEITEARDSQCEWLEPEELPVTFHIGLVGRDGVVVGSDRLGRISRVVDNKPQPAQLVHQSKYFASPSQSIVCFAAGGSMCQQVAQQIVRECDPARLEVSESDWEFEMHKIARTAMLPYQHPIDELLVVRSDTTNAFWWVTRKLAGPGVIFASIQKVWEHLCIGDSTVAQFLPRHLWTRNRSTIELERLALLTLSYAAREEPASIGPPFDIMTLAEDGRVRWSVQKPAESDFQKGLEHLFSQSRTQ
jgi:hypothetical protein